MMAEPSVLFSHPAMNAYTRSMAQAMNDAGMLLSMITTLGWSMDDLPAWLPAGMRRQLGRRALAASVGARLQRHPAREVLRLAASKLGLSSLARHETGPFSVDSVYQSLDRFAARQLEKQFRGGGVKAVYAGEDGALETFRVAKKLGVQRLYDLPIGYWKEAQQVYQEERERAPEFVSTLTGLNDSAAKLDRKEQEQELAEVIFACSPFVKASLLKHGVAESRIEVVPYGSPETTAPPRTWTKADFDRPLRVLFAGSLGQRKGIGYLLHAIQSLARQDVELVLMGSFSGDAEPVLRYRDWFRLESPRPHADVLRLMRECDVLVLPSLFEGLAMVVPEAMACGLPVIVTPSTGASFLVHDHEEGFVVRERSIDDLAEKVAWFADNRGDLPRMGEAAWKSACRHSWAAHREQFVAALARRLIG